MQSAPQYSGLNPQQVEESRRLHGPNVLTPAKRTPLWKQFLAKFTDPLIIILLVAGVLSIGISCYEYWGLDDSSAVFFEPIGIFIAILLATGLGFLLEVKAEKEFQVLSQVNDDEPVRVLRAQGPTEIPRRDVVVGDLVFLNQGDEVPADGQLLEATSLSIDESTLTGEPSCSKTTDPEHFDPEATYPSDMVLRGTKVLDGHGLMRVERVGDATENGKVMTEARIDDGVKTPLSEQLSRLGTLISYGSYTFAALIVIGRCIMWGLDPTCAPYLSVDFAAYLLQTFMIAVTLIVVAVPEGLPMAVTLSLAYSMRRMLRTKNLVRKLHACETMGATTVICTDKTGTLTQNQMQVHRTDFFGHTPTDIINEGIAVNSTASLDLSGETPKPLGNPTEGALLLWLQSNGVDYLALKEKAPELAELPFSTERKFMATIVDSPITGKPTLYIKGAPEIVMTLCDKVAGDISRDEINALLTGYQNQAMRTLALAYATIPPTLTADKYDDFLKQLGQRKVNPDATLLGIVAISDPVRSDVPVAVKEVLDAGIQVKIVTGDTPNTAREIGRQIGLVTPEDAQQSVITGPDFAALSDEELESRINNIKVIARARPGDKKRLVETLQKLGQVVAVTGDGTNDAPALKAAHVGLSMGDGTSVAKEASDITIIDNSFTSIGRAVMWGRSLYLNIQRFILFQMTVNVAACLIVLAGAFMGTESPLTVTQMLWVNLIMDTFAAMALASLPPSPEVMRQHPRSRTAFIISTSMRSAILWVGGIFFALLFVFLWILHHADIASVPDLFYASSYGVAMHDLTPYELSLFFTVFVFLQFWNLFNARAWASGHSGLSLKDCGEFEFIAMAIIVGQIIIVQVGGKFFNVVPLTITDWLWVILGTSPVLWIGEILRAKNSQKHHNASHLVDTISEKSE
ncbi:MAG: calcium-translocating P-type ATPase, PMCA-type [Bacteroidales bacterium]|nr:calcium-translocating P-type ATPase, PMCA-type [Bacteroidales bacterium]MCD8393858.1 calcium-translocating P-type ATPase, PMCA-type [Bacteroidales bacterium]